MEDLEARIQLLFGYSCLSTISARSPWKSAGHCRELIIHSCDVSRDRDIM